MFEDFLKIIGILLVISVLFWAYLGYKKSLEFLRILGGKIEGFFPLRSSLQKDDKKYFLKWGYKGLELILSSKSPVMGYLTVGFRRDKVSTSYDDEKWAKTILRSSKLLKLKEAGLGRLLAVNIRGGKIEFVFSSRKKDEELIKEVNIAFELIGEVIDSLKNLPSSSVGLAKENMRKWLIYSPVGVVLGLACFGLFSGYGGDALCENDLFMLGFRVLTPVFLVHFLLTLFILGKHLHPKSNVPILLVLYFAGYYLVPLTILDPFNAMLDRSEPVKVETRVVDKYWLYRGGFRLKYEGLKCSHRVSEWRYKKVNIGDRITLYLKSGYFGVRWVYTYTLDQR
jgi:hypothetical protein